MSALFISYSRVDSEFAIRLVRDLKAHGVAAWLDQVDIGAGVNWDEQIERALGLAEIVLVILSQHSATSENVKNEISHALELRKQVVPIVVTKAPVPLIITRLQREDFTGDYETAFSKLLLRLRRGSRTDALEAITPSEVMRVSAAAADLHAATAGERASSPSVEHFDSLNPATAAISVAAKASTSTRARQIAGAAVALLVAAGIGGVVTNRLSARAPSPTASLTPAAPPIPAPPASPSAIVPPASSNAIEPLTPPAPSATAMPSASATPSATTPAATGSAAKAVAAKGSVVMPASSIRNNDEAKRTCRDVCAQTARQWTGVWSRNSCTCLSP